MTEYNSDITNVRYILFYDERIGPGVRGKMITVHAIIYDCGTGATLSSNFIIPKIPGPTKVEKNYRGVITTEEGVDQPKFLLLQYRSSINRSGDTWDSFQHNYQQSEESYLFRVAETKHRESDTMFSAKGS